MPYAMVRKVTAVWTATSATASETTGIFTVKKGDRVWGASANPVRAASVGAVGTVSLGDGDGVAGYIGTFTPTAAANALGTFIAGAGTFLDASGGKIYAADDTIDVDFIYTSGGVILPRIKFTIYIGRETN